APFGVDRAGELSQLTDMTLRLTRTQRRLKAVDPSKARAGTRGHRAGVTRAALLRAAERLFAERGVDRVSMREVAAAAGQSDYPAVLSHFSDKREMLDAVLERHSDP